MKELLVEYAAYNTWANQLMIDAMLSLQDTQIDKIINSSFQSVRATAYHSWSAEDMWLQRLGHVTDTVWAESIFKGSFADACSNWLVSSKALEHYVNTQYEEALKSILNFKDLKNNGHSMPVFQVLQHVFNHATYHRGQLVTMLRQAGETKIPRTDFIEFARLGNTQG